MKHKKLQKKPMDGSNDNNNQSDEHSRDCEMKYEEKMSITNGINS
jgi:hypothetical protein